MCIRDRFRVTTGLRVSLVIMDNNDDDRGGGGDRPRHSLVRGFATGLINMFSMQDILSEMSISVRTKQEKCCHQMRS